MKQVRWDGYERPGCYVDEEDGKYKAYEFRDGAEPDLIGIFNTLEEAIEKLKSLS